MARCGLAETGDDAGASRRCIENEGDWPAAKAPVGALYRLEVSDDGSGLATRGPRFMTPVDESRSEVAIPTAASDSLARCPAPGADPDEIRDWFEFETIVDLPAPAISLGEAAADYRRAARADNTRRGTVNLSQAGPCS